VGRTGRIGSERDFHPPDSDFRPTRSPPTARDPTAASAGPGGLDSRTPQAEEYVTTPAACDDLGTRPFSEAWCSSPVV